MANLLGQFHQNIHSFHQQLSIMIQDNPKDVFGFIITYYILTVNRSEKVPYERAYVDY